MSRAAHVSSVFSSKIQRRLEWAILSVWTMAELHQTRLKHATDLVLYTCVAVWLAQASIIRVTSYSSSSWSSYSSGPHAPCMRGSVRIIETKDCSFGAA